MRRSSPGIRANAVSRLQADAQTSPWLPSPGLRLLPPLLLPSRPSPIRQSPMGQLRLIPRRIRCLRSRIARPLHLQPLIWQSSPQLRFMCLRLLWRSLINRLPSVARTPTGIRLSLVQGLRNKTVLLLAPLPMKPIIGGVGPVLLDGSLPSMRQASVTTLIVKPFRPLLLAVWKR